MVVGGEQEEEAGGGRVFVDIMEEEDLIVRVASPMEVLVLALTEPSR